MMGTLARVCGRFAFFVASLAVALSFSAPASADLGQLTRDDLVPHDEGQPSQSGVLQQLTPDQVEPRITVRDDMTSGFPYPELFVPPIFDAANSFSNVVLVEMFDPGSFASGFCTGTLIDQRTVLIAAHCVQNLADDLGIPDGDLQPHIYFAADALADYFAFNSLPGTSHIVHADYDRTQFYLGADIALVSLSEPVSLSFRPGLTNGIPYVQLATSDPALFETVTLVGYGQTGVGSDPGVYFDLKRRIATNEVDYIGPNDDVFGPPAGISTQIFTDFADPTNIPGTDYFCFFFWGAPSCTVTPTEGTSDNGDSGGPMFVSDGFGGFIQVGVTSGGGNACGGPQGGYCDVAFWTSVAFYYDWVQDNGPLRNLSALAGNGLWSNAAHWTEGLVPDNFDTPPGAITDFTNTAHYFNVILSAAGTTTLNDDREIDLFAILGASSQLTITNTGSLFVWGRTTMTDGVLRVDGTLDTEFVDQFGGRVQGTGTIISAVDFYGNFGGTVAPGNSVGTLTIVGDYVQDATSTFEVELGAVVNDLLDITVDAALDGTIHVLANGADAPLAGSTYRVLTTGGTVFGSFATVDDDLPGLLFVDTVTYGANFVDLFIDAAPFCTVASGPVQTPVCDALDDLAITGSPAMLAAINDLQSLDLADLPGALEALNPTRIHAQAVIGQGIGDILRNQFGHRSHDLLGDASQLGGGTAFSMPGTQIASAEPASDILASAALAALGSNGAGPSVALANGYGLFVAGDVAFIETEQPGGIGKDDADIQALTAGLDYSDGDGLVYGAAFSYLSASVEQEYGFGGETESDGTAVSAYGNVRRSGFYVDLYASLGWLNFDTERTLLVGPGPTFAVVNGSTDASQMLAGATLGFDLLRHGKMTLGGVGGLYYHSLDIDGYTETGSIFAAIIPDRTIDSLKGAIGGEATFRLWSDESVVPFVRVLLNHEFMDDAFVSSAAFAGGPSVPFTVPGPTLGETWPSIGVGLSGNVSEWTSVYLRYQGDLGRDGQDQHSISAAARIGF